MKPTKNLNRDQASLKKSDSSSKMPGWAVPGAIMLVLIFSLSSALHNQNKPNIPHTDNNLSLETIELDPSFASQNQEKAQVSAPQYGLQNQTVNQEQVIINLRDNAFQDGDLVTLRVNDRVIVADHYLLNKGSAIPVSVRPGVNTVKIYGVWDGLQNGMGISLAADVLDQGNATNVMFPQNATAVFSIIRR